MFNPYNTTAQELQKHFNLIKEKALAYDEADNESFLAFQNQFALSREYLLRNLGPNSFKTLLTRQNTAGDTLLHIALRTGSLPLLVETIGYYNDNNINVTLFTNQAGKTPRDIANDFGPVSGLPDVLDCISSIPLPDPRTSTAAAAAASASSVSSIPTNLDHLDENLGLLFDMLTNNPHSITYKNDFQKVTLDFKNNRLLVISNGSSEISYPVLCDNKNSFKQGLKTIFSQRGSNPDIIPALLAHAINKLAEENTSIFEVPSHDDSGKASATAASHTASASGIKLDDLDDNLELLFAILTSKPRSILYQDSIQKVALDFKRNMLIVIPNGSSMKIFEVPCVEGEEFKNTIKGIFQAANSNLNVMNQFITNAIDVLSKNEIGTTSSFNINHQGPTSPTDPEIGYLKLEHEDYLSSSTNKLWETIKSNNSTKSSTVAPSSYNSSARFDIESSTPFDLESELKALAGSEKTALLPPSIISPSHATPASGKSLEEKLASTFDLLQEEGFVIFDHDTAGEIILNFNENKLGFSSDAKEYAIPCDSKTLFSNKMMEIFSARYSNLNALDELCDHALSTEKSNSAGR